MISTPPGTTLSNLMPPPLNGERAHGEAQKETLFFDNSIVTVASFLRRRQAESGTPPKIDCSDPYLIAYLRGGKNEALRVATISLIDRGLLKVEETTLSAAHGAVDDLVRRPIEKALLRHFQTPGEAT